MTDKYKQIADCYGAGDFNDLEAKYIEDYVLKAARDVHLMWDEIQRLRAHLARIHYLVQYSMLPEEDVIDTLQPNYSKEDIIDMVDKEVSKARGTEDA